MSTPRRSGCAVIVALLVLLGAWFLSRERSQGGQPQLPTITINLPLAPAMKLEIADEPLEHQAGLSHRPWLRDGRGMLFVFDQPGTPSFWMKDVPYSLDIIYLLDGVVTEAFFRVPGTLPGREPATVQPTKPANQVLEVRGGFGASRQWIPETRLFPPDFLR